MIPLLGAKNEANGKHRPDRESDEPELGEPTRGLG